MVIFPIQKVSAGFGQRSQDSGTIERMFFVCVVSALKTMDIKPQAVSTIVAVAILKFWADPMDIPVPIIPWFFPHI